MTSRNPWKRASTAPTDRDISILFMTDEGLAVSGARWRPDVLCQRTGYAGVWCTPRFQLHTLDVLAWTELPTIRIT